MAWLAKECGVNINYFPPFGRVVVLDHHKTALEVLGGDTAGNVLKVIDMERSGATIARDYFKQTLAENNAKVEEFNRMRRVFEYIEDADLWRWNLPNSKAFSSGLKDLNIEFDVGANPSVFHQVTPALFIQLITLQREDLIMY